MKSTSLAPLFSACLLAAATFAQASETTVIKIAEYDVPVVKGGLYDRFRSNPPLSTIAAEAPGTDLSWFKGIAKEKVDIGFESYSPNFYYENSRVTAIFTADLARLRELMPPEVLEQVQPLQIWPGRGVVALTAYAYHYCDNDSYNEIGLSVVTSKPGSTNWGPLSLMGQSFSDDFWGYVLKLPVDTELAEVRGVVGYNLPKWLTRIDYREDERNVVVEIYDSETQQLDVTLETKRLDVSSSKENLVTTRFTNIDQQGRLTTGYSTSRQLRHASTSSKDAVKLTLTEGSLSRFVESLKLGKMVKYEYVPDFQAALYAPKPLKTAQQ
ncbi:acetoacetate decarboxylase (ADC) [Stutzerimonas stutzeri]|uniref:acetoacetate decarboxylase (ADC) n=1 Tax=Stutzerimonas stutzeri TaxID=316 RepID=UPI002159AAA8|nr:acetoacetate decarboxylase (ADC) [Stutzerimonas stutzeri]MBA1263346.1 acetoacetate decarboxylase (ADC) [Stutzerimonas stutzeri]